MRAPFHDGARQFKARENILKIIEKIYCQKANYFSKMENEDIRESWEWETDFEQSFCLDIGEHECLERGQQNWQNRSWTETLRHFVQLRNG